MNEVAFGRAVRLVTERSTLRSDFRIGLEAVEKATGRLGFDPDVQYDGDGICFRRGDVLFGKLRPNLRKAWLADTDGDAVGDFHVYRPVPPLMTSRYLAYLVLSEPFLEPVIASVYGSKMPRADWSEIRNIKVWVPGLPEQRAIADYLDRETAQIDAFIAKNEELITLLTERRTAFVDEALVRAGAGVLAAPLKRAVDFVTVGIVVTPAKWYVESGVPALRGQNVKPGSISTNDLVYLSDEGHQKNRKSELRAGDVLVVRTGQAGAAAVVPANLDGANAIDLLIVRPGTKVVPEFLTHFLNSDSTSRLIAHGSVGSIQGHFNVGSLRELPFPLLPRDEQRALARMLDEQTEKIDRAIVTARGGVALARERRAALISAAVTGKIDVGVAV